MWHPIPCLSSSHRQGRPMDPSARLYHCARCHCQVILCRRCDRGHVYCAKGCAQQARRDSLRRAGSRYQATRRGRLNNALRQRRFRARRRKVTHQGSVDREAPAVLPMTRIAVDDAAVSEGQRAADALTCHRCSQICSAYLRRDFLHTRVRRTYPP